MKYAIIKIGSKQYKVQEGDEILVEKIDAEEGDKIKFDKVLLLVDEEKRLVGQPFVTSASVEGKIISQTRGEKIRVATYKAKARYRRVKGHRQWLTKIAIKKITTNKKSSKKLAKK